MTQNRSRGVPALASSAQGRGLRRRRYLLEGACYHTISVTRERQPIFSCHRNAAILIAAIDFVRVSARAHVLAYAVLPDHLHLLVAPTNGATIIEVMKSIKNHSATEINRRTGRRGPVWQRSFYDRVIRDDSHLERTIQYIHTNPVRAGLAREAALYRFSTANPVAHCDLDEFLGV